MTFQYANAAALRPPRQLVKKLKFDIFSGDMCVGKNPFCHASVPLCGARGVTAG